MTGPSFAVDNPVLRRWKGDVEPLAFASFDALRHKPSATNRVLSLASDLTLDELKASAVARNTLLLARLCWDRPEADGDRQFVDPAPHFLRGRTPGVRADQNSDAGSGGHPLHQQTLPRSFPGQVNGDEEIRGAT